MKNLFKLTLLSAGFLINTGAMAQESAKKTTSSTSTTKTSPQDGKTATKSGKTTPQDGTTKKDGSKSDTAKTGGTRMAITEQGVPKRNKNKATTGTTDPAKKK